MKLLYLANARIPTPRAYGLQIMKTCEAFALAGVAVELITPTRDYKTLGDPFVYYGVRTVFKTMTLAVPDLLKYGALGFLASATWFSEKARWLKAFWEADAIYSRDALVLFQYFLLGRPLIFENVPDKQTARQKTRLPQDKKIVLYAGRLYARKGAGTLAESTKELPNVLFVFVGGTDNDIFAFKSRWGMLPNVTVVGHVPHEQIPLYLRAADLLVLPNSGKDEDSARFTSPMKLFEYMASETPMLASDVSAIREILDDTTAILVSPDDPFALARGIEESLADPESARMRARAARAKVDDHTWQKRVETIFARLG